MRGPLILVNNRVVGLWLEDATSLKQYERLFSSHGAQLRSVVIRRWADSTRQKLATVLTRLSRLKTSNMALTIDATFHDAMLLRSLKKLLIRSRGLFVYRDRLDFPDNRASRWFRRFSVVMAGMPSIRNLWFLHFPIDSDEVRLLRRFGLGQPCVHHRVVALHASIAARRFLTQVPTNVLANLNSIVLEGNDSDLAHIARLKRLKRLELRSSKLTDATVRKLGALHYLESLDLRETSITGAGLTAFRGHRRLLELHLSETGVTDSALRPLHGLPSLRAVYLNNTGVTRRVGRFLRSLTQLEEFSAIHLGENPFPALRIAVARRRAARRRMQVRK